MDCATAREAISAMVDGEDPGADISAVDEHLAGCAGCRRWREAAYEVTRRARVSVAHPAVSRSREVAAAVRAPSRGPWRGRLVAAARLGLAAVAVGQLVLTVPCLLFGHDHSAPEHVAHEMGALDAALAAGFLVAAWRPGRALGMRTLVGVASVLLVVTAVIDLAAGRTSLGDEAPHLLTVAGWLMICYLAATTPPATAAARGSGAGAALRSWRAFAAGRRNQPAARIAAGAGWPSARPASAATASARVPATRAVRAPAEEGMDAARRRGRAAGQVMAFDETAQPEDVA
jgi:predicted anti-sigma-YlaC factor YlaD